MTASTNLASNPVQETYISHSDSAEAARLAAELQGTGYTIYDDATYDDETDAEQLAADLGLTSPIKFD